MGLPARRRTFGHRIDTVHDFTVRLAGSAPAGGTIHSLFGGRGSRRSPTTNKRGGTGKARRSFQCDARSTPCPSGYRERRTSARPVPVAIFGSWPAAGGVERAGGSPSGEPRLCPACVDIGLRAGGDGRTNGRRTLSARASTAWIHPDRRTEPVLLRDEPFQNRGGPSTATDSSAVGQWSAQEKEGIDPRVTRPFGGGSRATRPSRHVPSPRPGFPASHSVRSERWRGEQPHGRTLDDGRSASTARCRDDDGTQVPEGECKATRGCNPIDLIGRGGHGREDAKVRMQRT